MKLYQIVGKDVWRRKKRVLYATLGVVIGTMTVIGILTIALAGRARIYSQLEKYGPNLTILPATQSLSTGLGDLSLGTLTVGENYIPADRLPQIRQIADNKIREYLDSRTRQDLNIKDNDPIAIIAPKLYLIQGVKGVSVMLVGIEPQEELKVKTWWTVQEGKYLESAEQALAGKRAAELLALSPGTALTLNGVGIGIAGVLEETGSNEDYQLFLSLETLQKLFNKEGLVSVVDIRALCNACPVEIIADAINEKIPGVRAVAVKQVAATEMGMLEKINRLMLALAGITLVVGGFGVVNTLIASVHERLKDIGIMRAVGASRGQILKVFIYEALIMGVLGGILGYGAGTLLAYAIAPLILEGAKVTFIPEYFPLALILAILIAVIATLYPATQAAKIRVADSFRSL